MGSLRELNGNPDQQSFPAATFAIEGEIPEAQCTEAVIQADDAITRNIPFADLEDPGAFAGFALTDKFCHITASVGGITGVFIITGHDDDFLFLAGNPGNGNPVSYYISNGGQLETTRDLNSFAAFIDQNGGAYTIKGGVLYTDMTSVALEPACSIVFDPLP